MEHSWFSPLGNGNRNWSGDFLRSNRRVEKTTNLCMRWKCLLHASWTRKSIHQNFAGISTTNIQRLSGHCAAYSRDLTVSLAVTYQVIIVASIVFYDHFMLTLRIREKFSDAHDVFGVRMLPSFTTVYSKLFASAKRPLPVPAYRVLRTKYGVLQKPIWVRNFSGEITVCDNYKIWIYRDRVRNQENKY